jgi:hypothetical protein
MWQAELCYHAGILLGFFFDPEDGGVIFFWNICWLSTDYTALYPNRRCENLKSFPIFYLDFHSFSVNCEMMFKNGTRPINYFPKWQSAFALHFVQRCETLESDKSSSIFYISFSAFLWVVMLCSSERTRRFRGISRLQDLRVSQARNQEQAVR